MCPSLALSGQGWGAGGGRAEAASICSWPGPPGDQPPPGARRPSPPENKSMFSHLGHSKGVRTSARELRQTPTCVYFLLSHAPVPRTRRSPTRLPQVPHPAPDPASAVAIGLPFRIRVPVTAHASTATYTGRRALLSQPVPRDQPGSPHLGRHREERRRPSPAVGPHSRSAEGFYRPS